MGIQLLIFISFSGLKFRYIQLASTAVLPRFYSGDVRSESWNVFSKCKRKEIIVMVEPFVRDFLGGDQVLGTTEIEVNPKTWRATGFVNKPGVLVGKLKTLALLKEFADDDDLPHLGLGDRDSDHAFMSLCKEYGRYGPDTHPMEESVHGSPRFQSFQGKLMGARYYNDNEDASPSKVHE